MKIGSVADARPGLTTAAPVSREILEHYREVLVLTSHRYGKNARILQAGASTPDPVQVGESVCPQIGCATGLPAHVHSG